jgi:hypothetical protein
MGLFNDIFGSRPKLPEFRPVNIDEEVSKTISSNADNIDAAAGLSRRTAQADTDIALANLEQFAPGSAATIRGIVNNIQSGLRGELPSDVENFVTDRANSRAVAGGFGGSGAGRNLELRDLGLTSLQRTDQAVSQAGTALQIFNNLAPRPIGVASSFLSPAQRINALQSERNAKFQADTQAAIAAAQPDPVIAELAGPVAKLGGAVIGASLPGVFGGASQSFGQRLGGFLNPGKG